MNQTAANAPKERLIRLPEVEERVGLKRSSIYAAIQAKTFPEPLKVLGGRASVWPLSAIDAWIAEQISSYSRSKEKRNE